MNKCASPNTILQPLGSGIGSNLRAVQYMILSKWWCEATSHFPHWGKALRLRAYIEHTWVKLHKCDQCDLKCQCAAYMKKQKRCHTSKSSNSHKAPCFQLLCIQYYLENVKLFSNHWDPGPGQICVQCIKWFCLNDDVKQHLIFHNGEKPYDCAHILSTLG